MASGGTDRYGYPLQTTDMPGPEWSSDMQRIAAENRDWATRHGLHDAGDPHAAGGAAGDPHDMDRGHPNYDPKTDTCDVHPEGCSVEGEGGVDDEEARGPGGPQMPGLNDLPSYTLFGQILKRFSK